MTDFQLILSISLVHWAAVMSPGPDFIMVVKNALSYSRKIGVYTALGIGCGIVVHILYTFLGIGFLIKTNPSFFTVLKYVGAAYIFYLGVQSLVSKTSKSALIYATKKETISPVKAFQIGFVTNALNVKASMFFLGLFTTMIAPDTSKEVLYFLAVLIVVQTTLWFILVSYFFTQPLVQQKYYEYEKYISITFGLLLILLAVKILL